MKNLKKIQLQEKEYFTFCSKDFIIKSSGFLTGEYFITNIKNEKYTNIFCPESKEILLISKY